ncbi:MAG: RNA polymerase sigma factor [Proteobacteria bacterium]|nr:RNA polymerase sigma factor [Pseudomonadota bacterium]
MTDPGPLIEPLIPALRRYAYALRRDHAAADDLVQDTLERALSRWSTRRQEGDLRAWLFTILRNLHVGSHRAAARRGVAVAFDEADLPGVAAAQDAAVEANDVLGAVGQLPEDQKSLLLLVGVEDFSYDEAARILDVPLGTVMSRLSRARRALRSILEGGRAPLLRRVK